MTSGSLLCGRSSQSLTPETNEILTKVLLMKRPGEARAGFRLTYLAALWPPLDFPPLGLTDAGGRSRLTLTLKQSTVRLSEHPQHLCGFYLNRLNGGCSLSEYPMRFGECCQAENS